MIYNNNEGIKEIGQNTAVQPDEGDKGGQDGDQGRGAPPFRPKNIATTWQVHAARGREGEDSGQQPSQAVLGAFNNSGVAVERDEGAEVVFRAQKEHGVSVRNQQEQAQAESDDEQHYRVIV